MRTVQVLIAALFLTGLAAQERPEFDVATLKRSPPAQGDAININLGNIRNGKLTLSNASLSDCIKFAWGLVADAQLAGPDWIKYKEIRFDVVAEVPPDPTRDRALRMLQTLLEDRLKLSMHHEQRTVPYLSLVIAKSGAKLPDAQPGAPQPGGLQIPGHIAGHGMTMQSLTLLLSRFERQTILDRTGLKGSYDFSLEWDSTAGPSLSTALEEQIGLRLEAAKGPLDVLVVDSAEKIPADN